MRPPMPAVPGLRAGGYIANPFELQGVENPTESTFHVAGHSESVKNWVAVKELKLSCYIGEPYYLLYIPIMVT